MRKLFTLLLAAASLSLAACRQVACHIEGTGDALKAGDTLFITSDLQNGTPFDTVVVDKNGHFEATLEKVDSVAMCLVYNPKRQDVSMPFFVEPGNIKLTLSATPTMSKVEGTENNEKWQQMNDTTTKIGMKINRIASYIYSNRLTETEQREQMAAINKLNAEFRRCVLDFARKNIGGELGYFIMTYYPDEVISPDDRLALLAQMPEKMKRRPAMVQLARHLEEVSKTATGKMMPDFKVADMNGTMQDVRSLVKKNKITILDFWASWCGPCRAEMPEVKKLYDALHGSGLGIIGISLDENRQSWQSAVKSMGMTWTQLSDLKGWSSAPAALFSVKAIPFTVVVDHEGRILAKNLRGEELADFVKSKLK